MYKLTVVYYSEYGRYLNRYRSIPLYMDALKISDRRVILSLHDTAKDKLTKSAKVIGLCIGTYHPHGIRQPMVS